MSSFNYGKIEDTSLFRTWRGLGNKDFSDEEWEKEFKKPTIKCQQELNAHVDVNDMVEDVFQCNDEPPTLKKRVIEIVGEVFGVANGVGEEVNGDHDRVANIGEDPMEIGVGDEVAEEFPFEDGLEP